MRLLVTGGLGFIGSNFINYWLREHPKDEITNVDKETYASDFRNINQSLIQGNYEYIKGDVCNEDLMMEISSKCDMIVNFAAESHVDNSIENAHDFLQSNYIGVYSLLQAVRRYDLRFHQISTDEVYGTLPLGSSQQFDEDSKYDPRNPYSATKAAADFLVRSYINTYGIKATISNCSNNFGPNQHREKLIPKTILNSLSGKKIPVYGKGNNIRDWIYVEDHCRAVDLILRNGKIGETYLVSSRKEMRNIDLVKSILKVLGSDESSIEYVADRLGHDLRYSIDPSKIENTLGWKPQYSFEETLKKTVKHYIDNQSRYSDK